MTLKPLADFEIADLREWSSVALSDARDAYTLRLLDEVAVHRSRVGIHPNTVCDHKDCSWCEVARCHKVFLDRSGSTTVEPLDVLLGRHFDAVVDSLQHHKEHHDREDALTLEVARLTKVAGDSLSDMLGHWALLNKLVTAVYPNGDEPRIDITESDPAGNVDIDAVAARITQLLAALDAAR